MQPYALAALDRQGNQLSLSYPTASSADYLYFDSASAVVAATKTLHPAWSVDADLQPVSATPSAYQIIHVADWQREAPVKAPRA